MAVLRLTVRELRVTCWLVKHRAAQSQITMTTAGNANVTWSWNGEPVSFGMATGTNGAVTMVTSPTWEEVRAVLGPDYRAIDWIQARYLRRRG